MKPYMRTNHLKINIFKHNTQVLQMTADRINLRPIYTDSDLSGSHSRAGLFFVL